MIFVSWAPADSRERRAVCTLSANRPGKRLRRSGEWLSQPAGVIDQRRADEIGLFGNRGVARLRDDDDGDPPAQTPLVLPPMIAMRERVVSRLEIEDRRGAAGIVLLPPGLVARDARRRPPHRMPAAEPHACRS